MELTTERLVLRELTEADWPAVLAYQSDPQYLRYYRWTERSEQDVRDFLRTFVAWSEERPRTRFQLGIVLKADNRLIGNCGLRMSAPDAHEAEIGYELDPRYWGHGYATEAARALLRFGFDDLKLHRIHAACIAENERSVHLLERIGMRHEGRLREAEWMKGRWWDTLLFGLLDHEWRDDRALR